MNNSIRAASVINCLADYLTAKGFKYDIKDNALYTTLSGEDFPVSLVFKINEGVERLEIFSQMPFVAMRERAVDVSMAISNINAKIAAGKFCLYIERSIISYESGAFYSGLSGFSHEFAAAVIGTSFAVVEKFNDKLYALNKGLLSLKDFLAM